MKTVYRRHNCTNAHHTFRAMAECIWPHADSIDGEGPYATVTCCPHSPSRSAVTVRLHDELATAQAKFDEIGRSGCSGRCTGNHDLIEFRQS